MPKEQKETRVWPKGYTPAVIPETDSRSNILNVILTSKVPEKHVNTDLFYVMSTRRSTRKFSPRPIEQWKIDKIIAAADTAPTAGNFQGFEIYYVKDPKVKERLVKAANNQPYVNTPIILVFCMNPERVKLNFPQEVLAKFSIQDATLAAAYSQLAASALGLSSIWIGMINEEQVKEAVGTKLRPSSLLCIGYPEQKRGPRSRRKLKDLIHVV
ncbi:MAG TPA: nitroreductase family protein [Nitrosopumilaceae archaeon]|nr:nitroreductase family protein [Nitrosopumilaceae archaeon]